MIQKNQTAAVFKKALCFNTRMAGRLAAVIVCACVLCGCAVFGTSLESPRITLSNFAVEETTLFETVFQVQIRVLNPNDIDLNVRGVDCTIEINEKAFAYGISKAAVQIPAFGSATVPVTVYASAIDIARGFLGMQQRDVLNYKVKGKARLEDAGWLSSKLPFNAEGTISVKDLKNKALPAQY